jgi:hypothetical protein
MQSTVRVEPLDELADELLAMTPEENDALWQVRQRDYLPLNEYLSWCTYLTRNEPPSREIMPVDAEPFEL